jgi:hypothetical protein
MTRAARPFCRWHPTGNAARRFRTSSRLRLSAASSSAVLARSGDTGRGLLLPRACSLQSPRRRSSGGAPPACSAPSRPRTDVDRAGGPSSGLSYRKELAYVMRLNGEGMWLIRESIPLLEPCSWRSASIRRRIAREALQLPVAEALGMHSAGQKVRLAASRTPQRRGRAKRDNRPLRFPSTTLPTKRQTSGCEPDSPEPRLSTQAQSKHIRALAREASL